MSTTRQSPHICRRRGARPGTSNGRRACRSCSRSIWRVPNGLAQRTQLNGSASFSTRGCFAPCRRRRAQARHERDRVLGAGVRAQAALHAVALDEAQLRPLGVVDQRRLRAGADAGHAQRAGCGVDDRGAERAAPAAGSAIASAALRRLRSRWSIAKSSVVALFGLDVEGRGRRPSPTALQRGRAPAAPASSARSRRRAGLTDRAQRDFAAADDAQVPRRSQPAVACGHRHLRRERTRGTRGASSSRHQHPDLRGAVARSPPARGRCRPRRCARPPAAARAPASRDARVGARRAAERVDRRRRRPLLWNSSAASLPPARA